MAIRGWRAWYVDAVYSSAETRWEDLPDDGLQIVKIYEAEDYLPGFPYTRQLTGKDWYYIAPDGSIEGKASEGWDGWVPKPCCASHIKRGTAVSDATFAQLNEQARVADTWP